MTSPIVEAVVWSSAKTNESWFSQSTSAASTRSGRCRRSNRSVRSAKRVSATKISPASAYRTRRVRERREPVREDVLRDAEVERPQQDRREQHELDGRRPPHPTDGIGRTRDEVRSSSRFCRTTLRRMRLTAGMTRKDRVRRALPRGGGVEPGHQCRGRARQPEGGARASFPERAAAGRHAVPDDSRGRDRCLSPALPVVSGKEATRALQRVGFEQVAQRGSHVRLRHADGKTAIVPLHRELRAEHFARSSARPSSIPRSSSSFCKRLHRRPGRRIRLGFAPQWSSRLATTSTPSSRPRRRTSRTSSARASAS